MRIATIFAALLLSAISAFAADVAGQWTVNIDTPNGPVEATLTLKQDGEKLTGTLSSQMGDAPLTGTVKENDVALTMSMDAGGQNMKIDLAAKVTEGKMAGSLDVAGQGAIKFSAVKKA